MINTRALSGKIMASCSVVLAMGILINDDSREGKCTNLNFLVELEITTFIYYTCIYSKQYQIDDS